MKFKKIIAGLIASALSITSSFMPTVSVNANTPIIHSEQSNVRSGSQGVAVGTVTVPKGTTEVEVGIYLIDVFTSQGGEFGFTADSPIIIKSAEGAGSQTHEDNTLWAVYYGSEFSPSKPMGQLSISISENAEPGTYPINVSVSRLDNGGSGLVTNPVGYSGKIIIDSSDEKVAELSDLEYTLIDTDLDKIDDAIELTGCDKYVTSINIPSEIAGFPVKSIGKETFKNLKNLKSVVIPDSVESIGKEAFRGCTRLNNVKIGSSVTNIGESAFNDCVNITEIGLPDTVNKIGDYAFYDCKSLEVITIPNSVDVIGWGTFSGCKSLESITIPENVWAIDDYAFSGCGSLKSMTIPDNVSSIGKGAFGGCSNLQNINVSDKNKAYSSSEGVLFDKNKSELLRYPCGSDRSKYEIPNTVSEICEDAFSGCSLLESVTIPKSVKYIDDYAFNRCSTLKSITIFNPECRIYDSKSTINNDGYNFDGCIYGLLDSTAQEYAKENDCIFAEIGSESIIKAVENGFIGGSATWTYYNDRTLYISGTGNIEPEYFGFKFPHSEVIRSVVIGNGITGIGNEIFDELMSLKNVTIPNTVTRIGRSAFSNCESLESLSIPDSVKYIDSMAFYRCVNLKNISIPNSVISIGNGAFGYCNNLKSISIPESVTYIDDSFENCQSLESITIKNPKCAISDTSYSISNSEGKFNGIIYGYTNSTAQEYAEKFGYNFKSLGEYTPTVIEPTNPTEKPTEYDKVKEFKYEKFENYVMITGCDSSAVYAEIPAEIEGLPVKSIGYHTFSDCSNLQNVSIPNSVISICYEAFASCKSLKNITIPDSVSSLGYGAFSGCTGLENVTIGKSVEYIGNYTFGFCESLDNVSILNPKCRIYDAGSVMSNKDYDYEDGNYNYQFSGNIYGYKNSPAQAYAEKYNRKFITIDALPEILGDINFDGKVTVSDVVAAQNAFVNRLPLTVAMDLNNDGVINVFDVIFLKRMILKLK